MRRTVLMMLTIGVFLLGCAQPSQTDSSAKLINKTIEVVGILGCCKGCHLIYNDTYYEVANPQMLGELLTVSKCWQIHARVRGKTYQEEVLCSNLVSAPDNTACEMQSAPYKKFIEIESFEEIKCSNDVDCQFLDRKSIPAKFGICINNYCKQSCSNETYIENCE